MRCRVADDVPTLVGGLGHDLEPRIAVDHGTQVPGCAVDLHRDGGLGESWTDRRRDLGTRDAVVELAHGAVGERQMDRQETS